MSYTVFKDTNNHSITAPNETGEIVLKTSIPRQIRIEVERNSYKFYDIAEKKYLNMTEFEAIDLEKCFFTAIIYPCGKTINSSLGPTEANYPILYKFVDSCLGSILSASHINSYNRKCHSNDIYFTKNNTNNKYITIEFEFYSGVKIRLNLHPEGLGSLISLNLASSAVEIISLFQHNITMDASNVYTVNSTTQAKQIFSISFSFINNRSEQYDKSELTVKNQALSMLKDLTVGNKYPTSGLIYDGRYSNGASTMKISVYTIKNIYVNSNASYSLYVTALFTGKESGSVSSNTVDSTALSISLLAPNSLSFTDDVTQLS